MTSCHPLFFRPLLALLLGLLAAVPARAQLDPRLQAGTTDFLDLFQPSSTFRPKPEILSVFDYSGSMASLMSHPLYRNDDKGDQEDYRYMSFSVTVPPAAPETNTYVIGVRDPVCGTYRNYKIVVDATGVATGSPYGGGDGCGGQVGQNLAPSWTIFAQAAGNTGVQATLDLSPTASGKDPDYSVVNSSNGGTGGTYTITHANGSITPAPTIELSPATGPYGVGTTVKLTAYLKHDLREGDPLNAKNIIWSAMKAGGWQWIRVPETTEVSPGLYKSETTWVNDGFTPTPDTTGDATSLYDITPAPGPKWKSGDVVRFSTYFSRIHGGATSGDLDWSVGGIAYVYQCPTYAPLSSTRTTGNTTTGPGGSVSWTIPPYCPPPPPDAPYVSVVLDVQLYSPSPGGPPNLWDLGWDGFMRAYTGADANTSALRKPDGSAVTLADVKAAAAGLYGSSAGIADVRNWIRAASHVRITRGFLNGSNPCYRTIDIPIPWKIMDGASTGNPLSSQTVLDRQIKDGIPYGSGLPIELDQTYKLENQDGSVFTTNPSGNHAPNSGWWAVNLYTVRYRPTYINWLFKATYQNTDASKPNYTTDSSLLVGGKNFIAFDALNKDLVPGQLDVKWGQGYGPSGSWGTIKVPQYGQDGSYLGTIQDEASNYRTPALTRLQATKKAAIQTWISHQADVYWAFRGLDSTTEAGGGTASTIDNDSQSTLTKADATTTHISGTDSGWTVLNNTAAQGIASTTGNSVVGMNRIASLFASGETPLTYAMARSLAQFGDPKNVFNGVVGTDVSQCGQHFLLLFTDGVDNNGHTGVNNTNSTTPYIIGSGLSATLDVLKGNQAILANKNSVDRSGSNWNVPTLAGIAAHLSDPSSGTLGVDYLAAKDPGTSTSSGYPSDFLPFAIKKRNGLVFSQDHRVTTMTIGVNLGGLVTDDSSPKRSLFYAAVLGRNGVSNGAISTFHPFRGWNQPYGATIDPNNDWIPDPKDPTSYPAKGVARDNAAYFFDATNPDLLSNSLEHAFLIAINATSNQATAAPTLPFVGASLGRQLYVGQFYPPSSGGVLWPGDLLSFGTQEVNGTVKILDNKGIPTTNLSAATALWSTSAALLKKEAPIGTARTLYTRVPKGTALQAFTDSDTDNGFSNLKSYVATSLKAADPTNAAQQAAVDNQKRAILQHVAGADITKLDSSGKPTANRASIMGDIINSAPAVLEYNWTDVNTSSGTPGSRSLSNYASLTAVGGSRFRLILVGTNQGWLHAFGEVTKTDASGLVTGAAVQELWSFMPTDFLKYLDYLNNASLTHRFMVDGSPTLYHLDLPPSGGGSGNGVVDRGERAVAVFGLGKGGRSYYALDVSDPFTPTLRWALVPDEAAADSLLGKFGFSTSPPALGRVVDADGKLRDAVFLGGGFSTSKVEDNFLNAASKPTPLGRSVMALDVYTGNVLASADLSAASGGGASVGPVGAGVVPFEFILNSGLAQRAYFLDYRGGLWAWGSNALFKPPASSIPSPYENFRVDSSKVSDWTLRKVYQDDGGNNARYTTLPAPFRLGSFPGAAFDLKHAVPAAVGIAMVSGDRNNPLDRSYSTDKPSRHRLTVVFDRQDSSLFDLDLTGITSSTNQLKNFTDNSVSGTSSPPCVITPGCDDYYLAPKTGDTAFGYYVNFPEPSGGFVPKGINPPLVVAGSLFYAIFTPTASDICSGGAGNTQSWLIQDVLKPLVTDTRTTVSARSGLSFTWPGAASDFIPMGTRGVLQGGMAGGTDNMAGGTETGSQSGAQLVTLKGSPAQSFVRPRVWRTVH